MSDAVKFDDLPGWDFKLQETSMNIYKVTGVHFRGITVEREGVDLEILLEDIKRDALGINGRDER